MTRLYRPVLIESAEQAEALPDGTVATRTTRIDGADGTVNYQDDVAIKLDTTEWHTTLHGHWVGTTTLLGWTALVPTEARRQQALDLIDPELETPPAHHSIRYVTPWEEA